MKPYWVYMLRCSDGTYYVGVTSKPDVRVAEHALGLDRKSYVYSRRPVTLVYSEVCAWRDRSPFDRLRVTLGFVALRNKRARDSC